MQIEDPGGKVVKGPSALNGKNIKTHNPQHSKSSLKNKKKKQKGNRKSIPLPSLQEQIDNGIISVLGENHFIKREMYQPQKWEDHYRRHGAGLRKLSITDKKSYVENALELLEKPVGGNILGHVDKQGVIVRFDKETGAFTMGHPMRGVYTLYIPDKINGKQSTPYEYYIWQLKNDLKYGGRCK